MLGLLASYNIRALDARGYFFLAMLEPSCVSP